MRLSIASPAHLWNSCARPSAAWYLVWMPLVLLVFDRNATLSSAMVRLMAVLLVAGLIWARGLGPSGTLADRIFVATWAGSWAAALVTLITAGRWPSSALGSAALFAVLSVGAGWLGWAYHERKELESSRRKTGHTDVVRDEPATTISIVMAWLLAALIFALLASSNSVHWGDGLMLTVALGYFTTFQRSGIAIPEPTG